MRYFLVMWVFAKLNVHVYVHVFCNLCLSIHVLLFWLCYTSGQCL